MKPTYLPLSFHHIDKMTEEFAVESFSHIVKKSAPLTGITVNVYNTGKVKFTIKYKCQCYSSCQLTNMVQVAR